ncbi:MAG: sel1 repeat family protein [Melioribacteraceae bacterium]|nr:sel1 repeat family protein [Melioribacteraceae bacterium]
MKLKIFSFTAFLFLVSISILAQDTTRSDVFRNDFPQKKKIIKAKYPSYSLIAGYILTSEANRGDPYAQHELGLRYLLGNGFPKDTAKAIYWIRKAVDQNLPNARFNYGIMLYNGIGVPWNPFEAFQNFKAASDAHLPEAQFALALLYTDNLVVTRDYNFAYKLLKVASKAKYKPAEEAINQLLKSGFIPQSDTIIVSSKKIIDEQGQFLTQDWDYDFIDFDKKDKDTSEVFVKNIFKKNYDELKILFGIENINDDKADTSTISVLNFAAENGSPEALYILGRLYEKGIIYKKNIILATSYLLQAYRLGSYKAGELLNKVVQIEQNINTVKEKVNKNDPDAIYCWAALTALGINNNFANAQALELLKKAVEKNHIPSLIELGLIYYNGTFVEKNVSKSYELWEKAKSLGSKEAELRLILAQLNDNDLIERRTELFNRVKKISEEGSVFAQSILAYCYEKGLGVRENKALAVKYYRIASQRGNQSAYNSLKRIYNEIRPDDEQFKIYDLKLEN